jgi:threo-3-hydroxy-L-aspartate ammonia-lyase
VAPVSLPEVEEARHRVTGFAIETPMIPFAGRDIPGANRLWLKAENLQRTGSFKIRGAYNAVARLGRDEKARGVITYSSGNHGHAVACAASALGVRAVVVMPEDAIPVKVEATRRWGAEIVFAGHTSIDRQKHAESLALQHGYAVIPPFDDPRIIAGQGTTGLEILEQLPEVDAIVVPIGGGGLISGITTAVKARRPDIRVIGVEPEGGADARDSLRSGHIVTWDTVDTVADGLRASRLGRLNFATLKDLLDGIVTVSDDEILRAVGILAMEAKLVAEPSGAVATAAVLFGHSGLSGKCIVSVISGGNIDPGRLKECVDLAIAPQGIESLS